MTLEELMSNSWSYRKSGYDKVSLPVNDNVLDHGVSGQFAVSDGNGGIVWKTLVDVEAVSY